MFTKSIYVIIASCIFAFISLFFNGFTMSNFINALFMISILTISYGFFKLMAQRKIFMSFSYSMKFAKSAFNKIVGDKDAYVQRVEREALQARNGESNEIRKSSSDKQNTGYQDFILEDIPKDELTLPALISGIITMLISIIWGFLLVK